MIRHQMAFALGLLLTLGTGRVGAQDSVVVEKGAELRFTIPPRVFAVVGRPLQIYVDNLILTKTPENYALVGSVLKDDKQAPFGTREPRSWGVTPQASDVGVNRLRLTLLERSGDQDREITSATTELVVVPADAGQQRKLSLLIVGDSLTHASLYPNSLARLLSQPGNPSWKMLGTHRPGNAADGVAHEGYGGWTWERFVSHFVPNSQDAEPKLRGSPFVFADDQGRPSLDPAKYFDTRFGGERPDAVLFLLGINDCFGAPPDNPQKIDERIDQVFVHAEKLLAAMHRAAPNADLFICATPPPNSRQEAFEANYQDRYTRWGWKRIQHRLVQRQIKQFDGREQDRVFFVPTELNVDPIEGYPANNGVHPNAIGYQQIAEMMYAALKSRLASK